MIKPYYDNGGIQIYHGDSHEILPLLDFGSIITDTPYGVGKDYGEASEDDLDGFKRAVSLVASRNVPASLFVPPPRLLDLPVRPQWIGAWTKTYGASGLIAYPIYPHWEAICFYSIKGNYAGNKGHRSDVFEFAPARAYGTGHPTPKPVDMMQELIRFVCRTDGVIADPFMGRGTTLRAAKNLGRKAVGIDIEEKYCELAANFLRQEVFALSHQES